VGQIRTDDLLKTYQRVDREIGWVRRTPATRRCWLMREGFLTLTDPSKVGDEELFPKRRLVEDAGLLAGIEWAMSHLLGRERDGVVDPGVEAEAILEKNQQTDAGIPRSGNGRILCSITNIKLNKDMMERLKRCARPEGILGAGVCRAYHHARIAKLEDAESDEEIARS